MSVMYELEMVVFVYDGHFDVTRHIPCFALFGRLGFSRGVSSDRQNIKSRAAGR